MGLPYSKRNWDGTQTERLNGKQDPRVKNQMLPPLCGTQLMSTLPAHSITLTKGTERPPRSRHTLR